MSLEKFAQLAFFRGLSPDDLRMIAPLFGSKIYVAGTVLFEQGDPAEYLYVVAVGEVYIRYKPDDGPSMTVAHIQPGNIFGWSAAMGNERYTSGAVCALDSEILFIRGSDLGNLCRSNPGIGSILLGHLSKTMKDRQERHQALTSK